QLDFPQRHQPLAAVAWRHHERREQRQREQARDRVPPEIPRADRPRHPEHQLVRHGQGMDEEGNKPGGALHVAERLLLVFLLLMLLTLFLLSHHFLQKSTSLKGRPSANKRPPA